MINNSLQGSAETGEINIDFFFLISEDVEVTIDYNEVTNSVTVSKK